MSTSSAIAIDDASGAVDCQSFLVVCHRISRRRLFLTVALTVTIIFLSSAVAWNGRVPAWERSILEFFNAWPDVLEPLFWVLQQPGVLLAPVVVGLAIASVTRRWQHFVAFAAVLPLKLAIEKGLIKQLVQRERPFVSVGPSVDVRGPAFEGLSFPSGHTTTAFATAILLVAFLPRRWRPIPIAWATIVGIARIYYGEHNALDVVAGAAMGTLFATVLWFAFLNRTAHPDCACADR
jgi:membrane-associated phospholipid phosphatase